MSLGADILATLPFLREQSDSRSTETLEFFTESFGAIPEGQIEPGLVETVVHSNVPGRVKFHTIQVSNQEQAGQLVAVQQVSVIVPVGAAPNARPEQFVRVTASTIDPSLANRKFRVSGMPSSGQVTAHRYPVEEVT